MSIETYQFNLPITPGAIPPVLHLSQYDSGRTFTAVLRDDANVPFELNSGATAVIKGRNAAGIAWQQDCTVSGANVTFTPSGAATDQFGVMPVTIEITESEEIISPLCVIFNIQKAGYTNEEAVLSPDFETAIQAAVAQAISEGGLGFSDEFKEALLACFNGVAWATTGGQALVDDLEAALYPEVHLSSITAAYEQDRPIYDTDSLDLVKLDLVVTANYSDGTSETLADDAYTLSGTLVAGQTCEITVSYGGKTATVNVVVMLLPADYQLCEYIQSSGTQYLVLSDAIYPASNILTYKITVDAQVHTSNPSSGIIAGCGSGAGRWLGAVNSGNSVGLGSSIYFSDIDILQKHRYVLDYTVASPTDATCDGTGTINRTISHQSSGKISLFAGVEVTGASGYPVKARIYYAKIENSGVIARELYPCYRKNDGVIGMYDVTTSAFITNAGTGVFEKGKDA